MTTSFTLEKTVHFQNHGRGRKELRAGAPPGASSPVLGPVPRVSRLLALALRLEALLRTGQITSHTDLAALGHVTRARISQILNLVHLAPDLQEELLFLQGRRRGQGNVLLADLQAIATQADWRQQRRRWRQLKRRLGWDG